MKIIKRSGMEVEFDRSKIIAAVKRANNSVVEAEKVSDEQVEKIAENVETICDGMNRALNVEEIQDLVENSPESLLRYCTLTDLISVYL